MSNSPIIMTDRLSKTFSTEGVQHHALKNVDLEIERGSFTVIMGASGAGKSTLLYALSGIDQPTLGDVVFDGTSIVGLSETQLALFRRAHCGFVFQQIYLLDNMSVMDNAMAAGLLTDKDRAATAQRARDLFAQVGVDETTQGKFPAQVSGGEAQRAAVVRALMNSPEVLFADEPTGALDQTSGAAVLDVITNLNRDGQSMVVVTHDLKTARRGTRILFLRDGCITGDLNLERYTSEDDTARNESLRSFLIEMGW